MKELAKHMTRARVAAKRRRKNPRAGGSQDEVLASEKPEKSQPQPPSGTPLTPPHDIPDAWDTKHRPEVEEAARQARRELKEGPRRKELEGKELDGEEGYIEVEVRRLRMKRDKRRRNTMSFAVSDEEEAILRAHLREINMSLSTWTRQTLFRAMGRRVPSRPKRP